MSRLALLFSFFLMVISIPAAFAEGGGGIECPVSSGGYSYIDGTANFQENSFEEGELGVLYCEYMNLEADELDIFGDITVVYHIHGEISDELIDEYGCGAVLAEQYGTTYVSSPTHFASAAYSNDALVDAATDMLTQIETGNIATICLKELTEPSTADIVEETIEEHEEIEKTSTEVIKEKIEIDPTKIPSVSTTSDIVLPDWIKNNAGWWSSGQITNDDFSLGIAFMINEGFIKLPPSEVTGESSNEIPDWVKNNAGWWSEGQISDSDFVNGLQFLISNGIIQVS